MVKNNYHVALVIDWVMPYSTIKAVFYNNRMITNTLIKHTHIVQFITYSVFSCSLNLSTLNCYYFQSLYIPIMYLNYNCLFIL